VFVQIALTAAQLLLTQVFIVVLVAWIPPKINIYKSIVSAAAIMTTTVLMSDNVMFGGPFSVEGRIFLALITLALGGFFFHFMTLPDRSVTLRILVELLLAPNRTLTIEELGARYGVKTMIASRLEQLQDGRFLTIEPTGTIGLLPGGERFGRFVTAGRRLFRIKSAN
jgi:hypothetical protein